MVVVVVVDAAAQHRVVDGRRRAVRSLRRRPVDVLLPLAAQDLPEGGAHLLVAVRVDDGVHGRVELGEKQEELFVGEDVAVGAEDVEEEDDQAGRPADDEGTCGDTKGRGFLNSIYMNSVLLRTIKTQHYRMLFLTLINCKFKSKKQGWGE